MPKIPENPLPRHHHLLANLFLNELLGLHSGGKPYEIWWVQPRPLDTSLDLTGRARLSTIWPDMVTGEISLGDILQRILALGGHVHVICESFSQTFTRSDVLASPEALINSLRLAFPETFQFYTLPRISPEQSGWVGRWGAVVGEALAMPETVGGDCRYVADPNELNRLRQMCHALAEGRATAFPEISQQRTRLSELDLMRAIIRRSGRYVDVERLPQQTARSLLYRAVDTHAGNEPVAIKVMIEPPWDAEQARLREAVARRLGHPNVVRIYEPETFALDDGRPVFAVVMEYMPGGSLKDELERKGRLPLRRAIEIAIQVCHGLAYAHRQGIVHRDVKPGNILLGLGGEAKIADFNIAKIPELSGDTWPGQPLGTIQYIPPEQVEHAHQATPKADIYSLGCVLYEMLVGRPPFVADSERELALHHQQSPPPPLQAYRSDIPEALEALVHRCLAKEPEARPSASELAAALERLLSAMSGEGVSP